MVLPSQTPRPTTEPHKNGMDAAAEIELQRCVNQLRRDVLDTRFKLVDWWLIAIGLVATIAGFLSFERFREIEAEGRQHVVDAEEYAEEAKRLVEEITALRDEGRGRLAELNAETVGKDPTAAARTVASVRRDPAASLIDKAIAAAAQLQQQGKIEEAIERWRSIANVAGEEDRQLQARAWFSIGYLLGEGEGADLEAAMEAFTRAIALNPADALAYTNRGHLKNERGQYQAALTDLDRAIALDPADALAYTNRGRAKGALGQYQAALADLNRAIALDPASAITYTNRGKVKDDFGQPEAALADYDQAIALNPTGALAYNNRGYANENLGRISEARADYQKAIDLAQEAGNENIVTMAKRNLRRLDNPIR